MSNITWVPRTPDEDDSRHGWYKCDNCGELGFSDGFCPKCGEGAKEIVATLRTRIEKAEGERDYLRKRLRGDFDTGS